MTSFRASAWVRRAAKWAAAVMLLAVAVWLVDPGNLVEQLAAFPWWATAGMVLVLIGNLFLVSFRFWRVLSHFGITLPWAAASRASVAGHVAGLVVISLFGQVSGRQAVLKNYGVPALVTSSLSIYERGLLLLSSGTLGVLGAVFLLGMPVVAEFVSAVSFVEIFLVGTLAAVFAYLLSGSSRGTEVLGRLWSRRNAGRIVEIIAITLTGQFLVLASFVIGIQALAPGIGIAEMLAAAAIISLAASMPISVNGWGIRELTSIFVLGHLGVPAAKAATISIMVGVCSTLVIASLIPVLMRRSRAEEPVQLKSGRVHGVAEIETTAAWLLSLTVAILVFFQAHISLPGGEVNVNLADPLAILALAAIATNSVFSRRMPAWRLPGFNLLLGIATLMLCIAFMRGAAVIGITQWALGGRLIGWLVLLGYVSAGYFLVAYFGLRGLRRFTETIAVSAAAVVLVHGSFRLMGLGIPPTLNFEGLAGNRNAFAVQLLAALSFLFVYSATYRGAFRSSVIGRRRWGVLVILGALLLTGLIWTGSRAGWAVGVALIMACWGFRLADRRLLEWVVIATTFLWSAVWGLSQLGSANDLATPVLSGDYSDQLRWNSYAHALALWLESPVFGAGLGVFFAKSAGWFGYPLVIHSTPLWILVEFGIVGLAAFGYAFFMIARFAVRGRSLPADRILQLLLFGFAAFGLVHEIFYQRIIWLALGVLLARASSEKRPSGRQS